MTQSDKQKRLQGLDQDVLAVAGEPSLTKEQAELRQHAAKQEARKKALLKQQAAKRAAAEQAAAQQQALLNATAQHAAMASAPVQAQAKGGAGTAVALTLTVVLLLVLAGATGVGAWWLHQQQQALEAQLASVGQVDTSAIDGQVAAVKTTLAALMERVNALDAALAGSNEAPTDAAAQAGLKQVNAMLRRMRNDLTALTDSTNTSLASQQALLDANKKALGSQGNGIASNKAEITKLGALRSSVDQQAMRLGALADQLRSLEGQDDGQLSAEEVETRLSQANRQIGKLNDDVRQIYRLLENANL